MIGVTLIRHGSTSDRFQLPSWTFMPYDRTGGRFIGQIRSKYSGPRSVLMTPVEPHTFKLSANNSAYALPVATGRGVIAAGADRTTGSAYYLKRGFWGTLEGYARSRQSERGPP